MGEYATTLVNGTPTELCKLGTLDDWRYVRRSEAERLAPTDAGTGTNIPTALQDGSTLYRFPWPDEDNDTIEAINGRSMFRTLIWKVPATILADFTHHELVPHVKDLQGQHRVNVWLPCPLGPGGIPYRTSGTPQPILALYGERYQGGIPRTIFACGYCEKLFSMDADDLHTIRTDLIASWEGEGKWTEQIARRLHPRHDA